MADDPYSELPRLAIDTWREQYRDLVEAWRNLDTKAQGITAIAGIFLGGIFALLGRGPLPLGPLAILLTIGSIGLLFVTFVGAISSLLVKQAKSGPSGKLVAEFCKAARTFGQEEKGERLDRLYDSIYNAWKAAVDDLTTVVDKKGCRIKWAQYSLLFAAVAVSLLAGIIALKMGAAR